MDGKLENMESTEISLLNDEIDINLYDGLPRKFSKEATDVFDAGRELWTYYHSQSNININASLYDIRAHFQGRNGDGRMNPKSNDDKYMQLITRLRYTLNILADVIKPNVYEYEFLKN